MLAELGQPSECCLNWMVRMSTTAIICPFELSSSSTYAGGARNMTFTKAELFNPAPKFSSNELINV
jgi:hypothetical protein